MISPTRRRLSLRARAGLVVGGVTAALLLGSVGASAQIDGIFGPSTTTTQPPPEQRPPSDQPPPEQSTTTTTASPLPRTGDTTTTTAPPEGSPPPEEPAPSPSPAPSPFPTPGPAPAPGEPAPPPPDSSEPLPEVPPQEGDGEAPSRSAGSFPPELAALRDSVVRTPANNTRALLASLQPLRDMGISEDEILRVGMGRFIIAGEASYSHDWWFPRFGPGWRLHKGTDVFAPFGTGVRAPVDGRVRITNGGLGGLSVYVIEPSGTYWYLTHLSGVAPGLVEGASVTTGQIVGYVGTSGNAAGTPPHVHIQIHPGGGEAIDPKAVLDQFIADALGQIPQVVAAYEGSRASITAEGEATAIVLPTVPAPAAPVLPVPSGGTSRAALLYVSSMSPAGGALQLAGAEAARAAAGIDWDSQRSAALATADEQALGEQRARAILAPLTPPQLLEALNRLGG